MKLIYTRIDQDSLSRIYLMPHTTPKITFALYVAANNLLFITNESERLIADLLRGMGVLLHKVPYGGTHIPQQLWNPLPFYLPGSWKRYPPLWVDFLRIRRYRDYPRGDKWTKVLESHVRRKTIANFFACVQKEYFKMGERKPKLSEILLYKIIKNAIN